MRRKWGHFTRKKYPSCTQNRALPTHHCTALQMPKVGVPASPWVWAKARSKLGALIRLCGDGVVSNEEAKLGSFYAEKVPLLHTEPGSPDPPPHSRRPPMSTEAQFLELIHSMGSRHRECGSSHSSHSTGGLTGGVSHAFS
jgi:hypothetical protein